MLVWATHCLSSPRACSEHSFGLLRLDGGARARAFRRIPRGVYGAVIVAEVGGTEDAGSDGFGDGDLGVLPDAPGNSGAAVAAAGGDGAVAADAGGNIVAAAPSVATSVAVLDAGVGNVVGVDDASNDPAVHGAEEFSR